MRPCYVFRFVVTVRVYSNKGITFGNRHRSRNTYHLSERTGWDEHWIMVRDFPKSANQRTRWRLPFEIRFPVIVFRTLMKDWNWEIVQLVRKFPTFCSERKKRTTSGGSPQFSNRFSGKLLFHLTFNRNFRIFWPNGKHPCTAVPTLPSKISISLRGEGQMYTS